MFRVFAQLSRGNVFHNLHYRSIQILNKINSNQFTNDKKKHVKHPSIVSISNDTNDPNLFPEN